MFYHFVHYFVTMYVPDQQDDSINTHIVFTATTQTDFMTIITSN